MFFTTLLSERQGLDYEIGKLSKRDNLGEAMQNPFVLFVQDLVARFYSIYVNINKIESAY